MNTNTDSAMADVPKNLHKLVGLAAGNLMPTAIQRNSFIVNEISRDFQIATDEKILATVLDSLLTTVIKHSKHSCIRISAKEYDDIIFVCVRNNSSFIDNTVADNLQQVHLLAKKMNGSVSVKNMEDTLTTIMLSFPNFPKAA